MCRRPTGDVTKPDPARRAVEEEDAKREVLEDARFQSHLWTLPLHLPTWPWGNDPPWPRPRGWDRGRRQVCSAKLPQGSDRIKRETDSDFRGLALVRLRE